MLQDIKLDDRTFQQLVDEMRKRIPFYCPEWTDHNVSDPGITLLELFAWMVEILLVQLNQVPELHTIRFLEMLGLQYEGPRAAEGRVTFWFSEPLQGGARTIDAGTAVATTQTESEAPQVFIVKESFPIQAPKLTTVVVQERSGRVHAKFDLQQEPERDKLSEQGVSVFCALQQDDALYLGFENNLSHHVLRLTLELAPLAAAGGGRGTPPYQWEAFTGKEKEWEECVVKEGDDRTENMNHTNYTQFPLPALQETTIAGIRRYWLRVRLQKPIYETSPRLFRVLTAVVGCSVSVRHEQQVSKEQLGIYKGEPDQRFHLQQTPVLARVKGEHLLVDDLAWTEVTDFADSAPILPGELPKKHYMLDSKTGELRFGPAIRQRDGSIKQYGQLPRYGAKLEFSRYRYGGGWAGNLAPGKVNTLKSSLNFVKRVENLAAINGGRDAETLDALKMRATRLLRGSQRAVTAKDFAYLARDEFNRQRDQPLVARAHCVAADDANPPQPGQVDLFIVPYVAADPMLLGRLPHETLTRAFDDLLKAPPRNEPQPQVEGAQSLPDFIRERCLLTTKVRVLPVDYQWVAVHVTLQAPPELERLRWEEQLLTRLYRFLNPITGGFTDEGWPFGSGLRLPMLYQCLQSGATLAMARHIQEITIFRATEHGASDGSAVEEIPVNSRQLIASGQHVIRFA